MPKFQVAIYYHGPVSGLVKGQQTAFKEELVWGLRRKECIRGSKRTMNADELNEDLIRCRYYRIDCIYRYITTSSTLVVAPQPCPCVQ